MKNVMRCTSVFALATLLVLPWQHVDVPMADVMEPTMVLPDPNPTTQPIPPPVTEENVAGGAVTCEDGCEELPTHIPDETPEMEDTDTPVPSCNVGWELQPDLSCCPIGQTNCTDPGPVPPPITEDDPEWDCRTMGNLTCGVIIEGQSYNIRFEDGQPVQVWSW